MNYRHAFHAGNFADVLKHIILARVLTYLTLKPTPICYIDTHAGIGWYDLAGSEAERTSEWRNGIGRLDANAVPESVRNLIEPYLKIVGSRDSTGKPFDYPGSPAIAQHLLRPIDRLLLNELHPEDATSLRSATKGDKRVRILDQDGYRTLKAVVPPPERRGAVLIDPPFEDRAECETMADAFERAFRKWPTGTYLLWYPIKEVGAISPVVQDLRDLVGPKRAEIELLSAANAGSSGTALRGSGLFIANPPYTLVSEAKILLPYLAACFTDASRSWTWRVEPD